MANKSRDLFQLERLAFFSDAVFAIAITLLVIEVRLPEIEAFSDASLRDALLSLVPKYIAFLVSFFVIGRFWIGHHMAFSHLKTCDDRLVWRNLFFLMTIAFMPFPTALISEYGGNRIAFSAYTLWLILSGFLYHRLLAYGLRAPALRLDQDDPVERETLIHGSWAPIIIGFLAFIAGMWRPEYAFVPLFGAPLLVRAVRILGQYRARKTHG
jgi:uncharacterized membrane protein